MTSWVDEMDAANRQDQADKRDMHDLREALREFTEGPPSRARQATVDACRAAGLALERDIRHVDAVWD